MLVLFVYNQRAIFNIRASPKTGVSNGQIFFIDITNILATFHPWQGLLFWKAMIRIVIKPKHMINVNLYMFFVLENLQQGY